MTKAAFFTELTALAHLLLQSRVAHRAVGGMACARVRFSKLYRTRAPTSAFAVDAYRHCAPNCLAQLASRAAHRRTVMTVDRRQIPLPARQRNNYIYRFVDTLYVGRERQATHVVIPRALQGRG
jgi:hypothetical protein